MHVSVSPLTPTCDQQLQFVGSIRVTPCHLQLKSKVHHRTAKSRKQRTLCITAATVAQDLRQWAQQRKLDLSKQAVQLDVEGDRLQLRCAQSANRGDVLLMVPDSLWITTQTVAKSSIGSAVAELAPWLQVALFLISERAAGSASPWAAYLQMLPEAPPSPLFWNAPERDLLAGTQLLQSLEAYEEYFEDTYAQLAAGLFSQQADLFPTGTFTAAAFKWAAVTVRGRSRPPLEGEDLALVPLADLVQHSRRGGVVSKLETGRFGGGRALKLSAAGQLAGGSALEADLGAERLDNQILLDYGVLDEERPQGGFLLTLALPEDDRNFDDKADILDINGFREEWQFALRAGQPPESGLLAFLRLMNCGGPDAFLLEALFRNETWGFMLQPVSQGNEDALCQSMIAGCRQALGMYPTTIDEDLELLKDEAAAPRGSPTRAAIQVRLGEKEGLDTALRWFEDRAKRLEELEYYQERRLKNLGLLDKETGQTTWDGFFDEGVA